MNICPDCQIAELDPLHAVYGAQPCCRARAIMATPERFRRGAAAGVKVGTTPEQWAQIRERLDVLIARETA